MLVPKVNAQHIEISRDNYIVLTLQHYTEDKEISGDIFKLP